MKLTDGRSVEPPKQLTLQSVGTSVTFGEANRTEVKKGGAIISVN
ncbi:MAG: hypothetical protein VXZ82_10705 [Planctomycetota bacterium]|nr:hypothetical protein [Planctomycetota bacterium]